MPVSFDQLRQHTSSLAVRRTWWHLLSVGTVWRDEVERHEGADKAGLHLFWVRSGSGWLETPAGRTALCRGARCWLLDLREPRAYEPNHRGKLVTDGFRFNGPMVDAWLDMINGPGMVDCGPHPLSALKAIRRSLGQIARAPTSMGEWRIHGLLTQAWGELLVARKRMPGASVSSHPAVQRVVDLVLGRPEHPWQAAEVAGLSGASYSALRAAFHSTRGETLHDFLQQVRLDHARALLADSRMSIKQVAARLEFRSESYFATWFRHLTGHTPGAHRRMLRG